MRIDAKPEALATVRRWNAAQKAGDRCEVTGLDPWSSVLDSLAFLTSDGVPVVRVQRVGKSPEVVPLTSIRMLR